jgi:indole-3-glycerol phosphate synthase
MNRLEPILTSTRAELRRRRAAVPASELEQLGAERRSRGDVRGFADALRGPGVALIAEHKRRSPSAGLIREGVELREVVEAYQRAGAAALSVLTEAESFGGSLDDLRMARSVSTLPLLRKDFILDPYQVHESLAVGADAILLIVAALTQEQLIELHGLAQALGLAALVEVHDASEAERALSAGAQIVGINNRNLTTLAVDTRRTFELLPMLRERVMTVAESGFSNPDELRELADAGVDGVLIGEALMRAEDIEAACRALTAIV